MMTWFHALMPKEGRFFDLFEAHARMICAGARALRDMLEGGESVPVHCRAISAHEQEADEITHEVMLAVRRTFITPFDRSDIRNLVTSMDDAVDQMHKTSKTVTLYELRAFEPDMVRMGDIIVKAADLTAESAPLLRSLKTNAVRLNELNEEITRLEEESDKLYDAGMLALYKGPARQDPMAFIVGGQVYDHPEKVADRLADVPNRPSGALIDPP